MTIGDVVRFGEFEFHRAAYELRRKGRRLRLARQPTELLLLLLEHPHALVSRDEIAKRLWPQDVFVDVDAGIHTAVLRIRRVLGDRRESPRFVETVPGKGYRFIAPVKHVPSAPDPATRAASQRPEVARRRNLPSELTSFIGRRRELEDLHQLLTTSRLLSLTGAGGIGKTRLAVRLASDVADDFPHGVSLIDLAPLTASALICEAIAARVGVRESARRSVREAVIAYVRDRKLLLVLDTCEHLIDGCAELAEALLREAPELRIVATSREALGVRGEIVYRVPSLSLPDATSPATVTELRDFEATQLFLERATPFAIPSAPGALDSAAVVRICSRLDGIPLAIELAAARVGVLSVGEVETRLQDRFRLLSGSRTAVARQRTLEATVAWSYELLTNAERKLFCRLGVFPASWTLEAADDVCGSGGVAEDTLEVLSRLVNKSLVAVESDIGGERRYRFLETVHHYARERLLESGAADGIRDRHFDFFYREFREGLQTLRGTGQLQVLARLQREHANILASLDWGLASPALAARGIELTTALIWFWVKRGLFEEGSRWLERALAVPASGSLRARALLGLAHMRYWQGRQNEMKELDEALVLGRQCGDAWSVSFALFAQSLVYFEAGDYPGAEWRARAAREADPNDEASPNRAALLVLGNIALVAGDHDRALGLFNESIELQRRAQDPWGLSIMLLLAAGLLMLREDFEQAHAQAAEALTLCETVDDPRGIAYSLDLYASLLAARGRADAAARLWGASDALLAAVGGSIVPTMRWIRARYFELMRTSLRRSFESISAEGRAMSTVDAIALARRMTQPSPGNLLWPAPTEQG